MDRCKNEALFLTRSVKRALYFNWVNPSLRLKIKRMQSKRPKSKSSKWSSESMSFSRYCTFNPASPHLKCVQQPVWLSEKLQHTCSGSVTHCQCIRLAAGKRATNCGNKWVMWPKGFPRGLRTISKTGYNSHYCYLVLLAVDLSETYPDILFKALTNISGFIHYDSGVPCGPKPIIKCQL